MSDFSQPVQPQQPSNLSNDPKSQFIQMVQELNPDADPTTVGGIYDKSKDLSGDDDSGTTRLATDALASQGILQSNPNPTTPPASTPTPTTTNANVSSGGIFNKDGPSRMPLAISNQTIDHRMTATGPGGKVQASQKTQYPKGYVPFLEEVSREFDRVENKDGDDHNHDPQMKGLTKLDNAKLIIKRMKDNDPECSSNAIIHALVSRLAINYVDAFDLVLKVVDTNLDASIAPQDQYVPSGDPVATRQDTVAGNLPAKSNLPKEVKIKESVLPEGYVPFLEEVSKEFKRVGNKDNDKQSHNPQMQGLTKLDNAKLIIKGMVDKGCSSNEIVHAIVNRLAITYTDALDLLLNINDTNLNANVAPQDQFVPSGDPVSMRHDTVDGNLPSKSNIPKEVKIKESGGEYVVGELEDRPKEPIDYEARIKAMMNARQNTLRVMQTEKDLSLQKHYAHMIKKIDAEISYLKYRRALGESVMSESELDEMTDSGSFSATPENMIRLVSLTPLGNPMLPHKKTHHMGQTAEEINAESRRNLDKMKKGMNSQLESSTTKQTEDVVPAPKKASDNRYRDLSYDPTKSKDNLHRMYYLKYPNGEVEAFTSKEERDMWKDKEDGETILASEFFFRLEKNKYKLFPTDNFMNYEGDRDVIRVGDDEDKTSSLPNAKNQRRHRAQ